MTEMSSAFGMVQSDDFLVLFFFFKMNCVRLHYRHYSFWCLNCPKFGLWEPLPSQLLCVFDILLANPPPNQFLSISVLSGARCPRFSPWIAPASVMESLVEYFCLRLLMAKHCHNFFLMIPSDYNSRLIEGRFVSFLCWQRFRTQSKPSPRRMLYCRRSFRLQTGENNKE